MEKTYDIEWMEKKTTSTGKLKYDASLREGEDQFTGVTIWSDFPGFTELVPGSKITGTLTPDPKGKFGPTLYPPKPQKAQGGGYKQKMIEDTMIKKEQSISRFQDSKEYSIKVSSTFRAAVDSAIAEWQEQKRISPLTAPDLASLFEKWREFYWMNFDVEEGKKYAPF